jgi:hypothetical protein
MNRKKNKKNKEKAEGQIFQLWKNYLLNGYLIKEKKNFASQ